MEGKATTVRQAGADHHGGGGVRPGRLRWPPKECEGAHIDPLLPWGKFSRKYKLTAGMNFYSEDPHVVHVPSGLKFPITWKGTTPYLYQKQATELKMVHNVHTLPIARFKVQNYPRLIKLLRKVAVNRSEVLQKVIAKKIDECTLQQHRTQGHVNFLAACPECRAGAIKQRTRRRQAQHLRPGGELSVDLSESR